MSAWRVRDRSVEGRMQFEGAGKLREFKNVRRVGSGIGR